MTSFKLFYVFQTGSSRKFFGEISAQVPTFTLDAGYGGPDCTVSW